jgi:excisionase family DNA binding protein
MEKASPTTSDTLLTRQQACSALSIKSTKYWELIRQGRLDVVRLGKRCTRIKRSSVERLISGGAA